jgi:hypothetical protein
MAVLAFRLLTTRWATGNAAGTSSLSPAIAWLAVSGFGLTGWVLMAFTWMPAASYAIAWLQRAGLGVVLEGAVVLAFYRLAFWQEDKERFEAMGGRGPAEEK